MKAIRRKITPVGLGDRSGPADAGGLIDADRVVIGDAGDFRSWSGMRRVWESVLKTALHGAATGELRILRGSQTVVDRHTGHLLLVADDATANRGRVLAVAHHPSGLLGTAMAGAAVLVTGSGLDDLSVREYFDGDTGGLFVLTIATAAAPDTFDATLDGAAVATGTAVTGDWQQVGTTGLWIKFAATTGHTAANAWRIVAGGRPCIAGSLNRLNAHHYPLLAATEGKTIVAHAFDVAHVDDGTAVRELGLPTPRLPPTLGGIVDEAATDTAADVGFEEDLNEATDVDDWDAPADVTLASATTVDEDEDETDPAEGDRCMSIEIPARMRAGGFDVCWKDFSPARTIPATSTFIKLWLYLNEREWRRNPLDNGAFAVVIAADAALAGERIVINIEGSFNGVRWHEITIPWTRQTAFTFQSIGIRLDRPLPALEYDDERTNIAIDHLRIDSGEVVEGEDGLDSVPTSEVFGEGTGEWVVAFTWANPERRLESGMSPASKPLRGNGGGFEADLSGYRPGIATGLANAVPTGATHAHLYLANTLWGPDPQTGGYQWRRVSPIEGIPVESLANGSVAGAVTDPDAPDDNTGNGNVYKVRAKPGAPAETWTLEATSATNFTVTGSVSGAQDAATVGTPYQNPFVSFVIEAGGTPFVAGDDFTFPVTTTTAHGNGRLLARLTDPKTEAEMLASEPGPWFNGRPPGANIVVPVGRRVIFADLPGVEFDATLTADSPIVTLSGLAAGAWMEGRRFQVLGESRTYWVLKATSATVVHIVETYDPDAESGGAYDGTSGTKRCRLMSEKDSFVWTNITARRGVDCENASPLANYNFPGSAFCVGGIVRVGSFLWCIHRWGYGAYIFRIAEEAKDDSPANGMAFSDPDFMKDVSCISQRSIVEVAPGQAYWIGARGEVWYAVGGSAQVLPGPSAMMRGILAGRGIVLSAAGLVDCHGVVVSEGADRYIVWVFRQSGEAVENASGDVGVEPRAADPLDITIPTTGSAGRFDVPWPPAEGFAENLFFRQQPGDVGLKQPMVEIAGLNHRGMTINQDGLGWNDEQSMWSDVPTEAELDRWQAGSRDTDLPDNAPAGGTISYFNFVRGDVSGLHGPDECFSASNNYLGALCGVFMRPWCGVGLFASGPVALGEDDQGTHPTRNDAQRGAPWIATWLYDTADTGNDVGTLNWARVSELALYTVVVSDALPLDIELIEIDVYKDGSLLSSGHDFDGPDEIHSFDDGGLRVFFKHTEDVFLPDSNDDFTGTVFLVDKRMPEPPPPFRIENTHWDEREPEMTIDEDAWALVPDGHGSIVPQNWNSKPITAWDNTTAALRTLTGDTKQIGSGCWAYTVRIFDGDLSLHTNTPGTPLVLGDYILRREAHTDENGNSTTKRVLDENATYIRLWLLFSGEEGSTLPGGTFRFRLRYDPDQKQLDSPIVYTPDDDYDVMLPIEDDLPANEWTAVYLEVPAGTNGTYLDMNGDTRNCKFYDRVILERVGPIPQACFRVMSDVDPDSLGFPITTSSGEAMPGHKFALSWTGGHQIAEQEVVATPGTLPAKECRADNDLDTGAVEGDFDVALRLRIADPPSAWIATECPVTAFDRERHEACSTDGRLTGAPIFGDRHGFVGLGPEAGWLPWFGPEARIVWNANPDGAGSTTVFNVQRVHEGVADILSLPVDPDGTGTLVGLLCAKVTRDSDGQYRRWESRRIASNTVGAVTVASAWTAAPTINDRLLVAPMLEMIHLPEIRTTFFSSLRALALNLDDQTRPGNANTFPVLFRLEQFEGATDAMQADNATPTATAWFNSTDLRSKREISVPAKASKARSYRLSWIGRETGACTVRNLVLTETMHEAEGGR